MSTEELQIQQIAELLKQSQDSSILYDIFATIPAALLAATAAIIAAWATGYFHNKTIRNNVNVAVKLEVDSIKTEINRVLDIHDPNEAINCNIVHLRSIATPVFVNNAQYISMLDEDISRSVFNFYTKFFTIPESSEEGKYLKKDLQFIVDVADDLLGEGIINVR